MGISLLVLLVHTVGLDELVDHLARAAPAWLLLVVVLSILWLYLGAYNVWILLGRLVPLKPTTFSEAYMTSWATALLIPGQLGDATQVLLLRRHGIPGAASAAAYIMDKVVSLTWLALVAAYGVARYAPEVSMGPGLALLVLAMILAGAAFVLLVRFPVRSQGLVFRLKLSGQRLFEQLNMFTRYPGTLLRNAGQTIIRWMLMALIYLAAFKAFDGSIGLEAAATIPVMSSLVGYIPVTPGGAGTVEWTAVFLFSRASAVDEAAVLSVYLFLRGLLIVLSGAFLLAFVRR